MYIYSCLRMSILCHKSGNYRNTKCVQFMCQPIYRNGHKPGICKYYLLKAACCRIPVKGGFKIGLYCFSYLRKPFKKTGTDLIGGIYPVFFSHRASQLTEIKCKYHLFMQMIINILYSHSQTVFQVIYLISSFLKISRINYSDKLKQYFPDFRLIGFIKDIKGINVFFSIIVRKNILNYSVYTEFCFLFFHFSLILKIRHSERSKKMF